MLLENQISVFFNHQYLSNVFTSDSGFLYVDRHEWTWLGLLMGFLKNIYFRAILGLKMTCRHNFGSTLRIFLKLCTIKRSQEVHGNYINGFSEKIVTWSKWAIPGLTVAHSHNFGSTLRIVLKFCTLYWHFKKKKISFKPSGQFRAQKWCILITLDPL